MARWRRGSVFVRDLAPFCRPLDREQRARILYLADALERRTKPKGARNGCLGQTGLQVLRCLLLRFLNTRTGLCCPSYDAIQAATGLSRQAVAAALDRLEAVGLVGRTRRLVREIVDGVLATRQASNLYRMAEPRSVPAPRPAKVRPFPARGALAALAATALLRAESTRKTASHQAVTIEPLTYVAAATCWRERARASLERAVAGNSGRGR